MSDDQDEIFRSRRARDRDLTDEDTAGSDIRIAIAKLSERSRSTSEAIEEIKHSMEGMQQALNDIAKSRTLSGAGDRELRQTIELLGRQQASCQQEVRKEIAELKDWQASVKGSTKTLIAIITVAMGAVGAALGWTFLTVTTDHTDLALVWQALRDHEHHDLKEQSEPFSETPRKKD